MFDFSSYINLPMIWGALVAVAVLVYVLLDGFDLGVGILFPFAPSESSRQLMMNSIAPFWDGNETWLILGGGGLFVAFPKAYSIIMPALYMPIILMLIGLVFRGVSFEFRAKAHGRGKEFWGYAFHFGSVFTTFMQGIILGTFLLGFETDGRIYTGSATSWLQAYPMICGLAALVCYSLLGSTWTIMKTSGETKAWAIRTTKYLLIYVGIFAAVVTLWMPFIHEQIADRWFTWPHALLLAPFPIIALGLVWWLYRALSGTRDWLPFVLLGLIVIIFYLGLIISIWPWVVPYKMDFTQAAASGPSLSLLLVGAVPVLPVILAYVAYVYYVFRGKTKLDDGYAKGIE